MMAHAFIQTNKKQRLGALLAKYALNRHTPSLPVSIMQVEEYPEFEAFVGHSYLHGGMVRSYDPDDLQSFTLTRFKPPELMGYEGMALVIDPDIFALTDVSEMFTLPRHEKPVLACRKRDAWDSSVMVLDCAKLRSWSVPIFLDELKAKRRDYSDYSTLRFMGDQVGELSRDWNSLDAILSETKFLHTTNRLTQPWKTGLPIDFHREPLRKKFGIIPREWLYRATGRYATHYQSHPDKRIETFFFSLLGEALTAGALTRAEIEEEMALGHVRPDLLSKVDAIS